jgi:hypothetical protein
MSFVRRSAAAGLAAGVALSLLVATVVLADTTKITDAKGDVQQGSVDIKSALAGHTSTGKLRHVVVAYATFKTGQAPCIHIKTVHFKQDDFIICGDGVILAAATGGTAGTATVTRPDQHTVQYVFTKKALDNPSKYRWRIVDANFDDAAPNQGYVVHDLS